jgi:hypothetical protein
MWTSSEKEMFWKYMRSKRAPKWKRPTYSSFYTIYTILNMRRGFLILEDF